MDSMSFYMRNKPLRLIDYDLIPCNKNIET
jgi:hypothetical protein